MVFYKRLRFVAAPRQEKKEGRATEGKSKRRMGERVEGENGESDKQKSLIPFSFLLFLIFAF